MKKILSSIVIVALIFSNAVSYSQTTHPVELGFNLGASWLQSDVKMKKLGGAGGFTLGQMYLQNDRNALYWGWRFRYLNALAYGQDSKKSTGIAHNTVLNGTADTALNYYSNGGFVYQNYKTTLNELSLELVIGANRLRNTTKFYPYLFGGLGITKAVVKTNQLNANNFRYNYLEVDSLGTASGSEITTSLNNIYDGSYETTAEGSKSPSWRFMPSLGVGLGYQFTPGFSMGLEHKMTWALSDGLDGQQWANDNTLSVSKDKYHYSSIWLKFSFGRKPHTTPITNTNVNTNPITIVPSVNKPSVVITNPAVSPYTSTSQSYTVKATIKNVASKSDIGLVYNGVSNTNFTYDATSQSFAFPLMLTGGSNTFMITATNADGSTTDNATVIYETQVVTPPSAPAPKVTINSPNTNPFSTTANAVTILASVLNVTSQSQIAVTVNGVSTNAFSYNVSSHVLNMNSTLNPGANSFVVTATNASGSDSKSLTVIYTMPNVTPAPVVTILNPAVNPFTSTITPLPVNALVQNVTSVSQVSVTVNGALLPASVLSFNTSTGQLGFSSNLIIGANSVTVSASTPAGSDSKAITIIYNQPVAIVPAPVVTITSPTVNPFNTSSNIATVNATVLNVTSSSQIAVTVNGANTAAFSYNVATKQFAMTTNLIGGANVVNIAASNVSGSDSKSQTIIFAQQVATPAPIVTITSPTVNPYNTNVNTSVVNATVLNVSAASQIAVTLNGAPTSSFAYNMATKQLTYNASLIAGANMITISAATSSGTDSKSQTIIYSQPAAKPAPIVAISLPAVSPSSTTSSVATVNASVLNVSTSSQISVSVNGAASPFTFNPATTQLTMNANLIAGANIVTISANNLSGSDSKSTTIIYEAIVAAPSPVVTITTPNVNPYNTSVSPSTVNATVLNVSSSSEIAVSLNGASVPFSYNLGTKQLSLSASLVLGANMVTVSATTASGTASRSTTIIYSAPVATISNPIVTITTPNINPYTSSVTNTTVNATVLNVSSSSEITASLNGVSIPFTYTLATKQLTLIANLIAGANSVVISATTPSGSDSKSTTIIYTAPVAATPAPVVTFITPNVNPFNTTVNTCAVLASATNVATASQITVTVNGVSVPFSFNALSHKISFTASLISGGNSVTVSATTPSGSDSKATTIIYTAPVVIPAPIVTITNPATSAAGSSVAVYAVEATVLNVTAAGNITVSVNGVNLTGFGFNSITKKVTFNASLNEGNNTIIVSATNASGSDSKTVMIKYLKPISNPLDFQNTNSPIDPGATGHTVGGVGHGTVTTPGVLPAISYAFPSPYTTINSSEVVGASVTGVTAAADIIVKVNGIVVPFSYSVIKKTISFTANLNMGSNIISVVATNATGAKTVDLTIIRN